jgi:TnpA family transposase
MPSFLFRSTGAGASIEARHLDSGFRRDDKHDVFQELGKVVGSACLLEYLRKPELRRAMNHATTVSERFANLIQFVTFGDRGTAAANSGDVHRTSHRVY